MLKSGKRCFVFPFKRKDKKIFFLSNLRVAQTSKVENKKSLRQIIKPVLGYFFKLQLFLAKLNLKQYHNYCKCLRPLLGSLSAPATPCIKWNVVNESHKRIMGVASLLSGFVFNFRLGVSCVPLNKVYIKSLTIYTCAVTCFHLYDHQVLFFTLHTFIELHSNSSDIAVLCISFSKCVYHSSPVQMFRFFYPHSDIFVINMYVFRLASLKNNNKTKLKKVCFFVQAACYWEFIVRAPSCGHCNYDDWADLRGGNRGGWMDYQNTGL